MVRVASAALAALLAVAAAQPAAAEPSCTTRQTVLDYLAREYHEAPVAMGTANNGGLVEILTNSAGSTWTILITMPDGMTCMIAAGHDWRALTTTTAARPTDPGA